MVIYNSFPTVAPHSYSTAAHYADRGYDVAFTYRLPLDMREASYFQTTLLELPLEFFTSFQPPAWSSRVLNVASIISHCVPERENVIEALSQHVKVKAKEGPVKAVDFLVH